MTFEHAPGHYDGDNCRFPTPGHFIIPRTEQAQQDADNRAEAERAGEFTPQPDSHRGQPGWFPSRDEWDGDGR